MCGIVGIIAKSKTGFNVNETTAFSQMLFTGQLRGTDGTGIMYNNENGEPNVVTLRAPYNGTTFLNSKNYDKSLTVVTRQSNFAIGHNRAATKGKLTAECTHPFREKHITLVHNGTLTTQKELHPTLEVDSHAICHSIAHRGATETLKMINGAFALVWFDSDEQTLNLVRNFQRPLSIIEFKTCYIVCSELEMGLWIGSRNKLDFVKSFDVTPSTLYKFKLEDMSTFSEVKVDFCPFYQTPATTGCQGYTTTYQAPTTDQHGNIKLRSYPFGQLVKFRTGVVIKETALGCNLEGDLLRLQTIQQPYFNTDYEDEYRLTIWGTREELEKIKNSGYVEGTISSSSIYNGYASYTICNARVFSHQFDNVKSLPFHQKDGELADCNWCGSTVLKKDLIEAGGTKDYQVCSNCSDYFFKGGMC